MTKVASGWRYGGGGGGERHLDGGLGEGHSEVVVLSQIVVVELDERLDRLLHGAHLDQGHLAVFPVKKKKKKRELSSQCQNVASFFFYYVMSQTPIRSQQWKKSKRLDLLKELEGFDRCS